jgi:LytR cell envelope-related transcriptional attenuator
MTDFIAALEEQLVTAHREPPARRFAMPWRGGAVLVATAAAVAAVVAVVVALATPNEHRAATKPPTTVTLPAATPRYDATVAVLNGTTVAGLARAAAEKLVANGFREGVVTNDTTNQNRRRTTIYYEPGYREQAQGVAACVEVGVNRVHPMNANARVAGDRADIVVFIGADKAK